MEEKEIIEQRDELKAKIAELETLKRDIAYMAESLKRVVNDIDNAALGGRHGGYGFTSVERSIIMDKLYGISVRYKN